MKRALLLLLALIIAAHYFWTDDWILLSGLGLAALVFGIAWKSARRHRIAGWAHMEQVLRALLSGGHNGPRTSHTRPQFSLPLRFGQEEQEMLQRIRLTRLLAPGPRGSRIRG